jgi:hypothetical protein
LIDCFAPGERGIHLLAALGALKLLL